MMTYARPERENTAFIGTRVTGYRLRGYGQEVEAPSDNRVHLGRTVVLDFGPCPKMV